MLNMQYFSAYVCIARSYMARCQASIPPSPASTCFIQECQHISLLVLIQHSRLQRGLWLNQRCYWNLSPRFLQFSVIFQCSPSLYPSSFLFTACATVLSVKATVKVISGREGTFRVKCTSFGGKTFTMDVEGPGYSGEEQGQMRVEAVGEPLRMENDTYSATTSVIAGGCNGDTYQCTASNRAAPDQNHTVELKGIHDVLSEYVYSPTRFQCRVLCR